MSNPTTVDNQQPYLATFPQLLQNQDWNFEENCSHPAALLLSEFLECMRGALLGLGAGGETDQFMEGNYFSGSVSKQ